MSEPDELYTLRAQFWLGHYSMALDEAKSIARRPMSPALKAEREVFLARTNIAFKQYDKVTNTTTGGDEALQALSLQAQYLAASGNEDAQSGIIDQLKSLSGSNSSNATVQLVAAQVLLTAGQLSAALACVHSGATLEHVITCLQLYLHLDRLDLAKEQMQVLRQRDDDSVLTQLGSVYVRLAEGSSGAKDALHTLNALSEQYGASPYLLNLVACALMQQGQYSTAQSKLQECISEFAGTEPTDTYLNMVTSAVHQRQPDVSKHIANIPPTHSFGQGLQRVQHAFDREAVKYKV